MCVCVFYFCCLVCYIHFILFVELRASNMLNTCSTTKQYLRLPSWDILGTYHTWHRVWQNSIKLCMDKWMHEEMTLYHVFLLSNLCFKYAATLCPRSTILELWPIVSGAIGALFYSSFNPLGFFSDSYNSYHTQQHSPSSNVDKKMNKV